MKSKPLHVFAKGILLLLPFLFSACEMPKQPSLLVTYTSDISEVPLNGKLFLLLSTDSSKAPVDQVSILNTPYMFVSEVNAWKSGEPFIFHKRPTAYPTRFDSLQSGMYYAQFVLDINQTEREVFKVKGNAYSQPKSIDLHIGDDTQKIEFLIDQTFEASTFPEAENVEEVLFKSEMLSRFNGADTYHKAAVILPEGYDPQSEESYPTLYIVPGFGGDHHGFARYRKLFNNADHIPKVIVLLDPNSYHGHHVFANSENNGPRGDALVQELIPYLEANYKLRPQSAARLLNGHSSGGWSTLWLQVNYPETFGGTWSTAPDPIDFRDFSQVNLYADTNLYFANEQEKRPISRPINGKQLYIRNMASMEKMMGHGGQFQSFNAVFSDRAPDGEPYSMWDWSTGTIRQPIVEQWKDYDINLLLRKNREELAPKLDGKIHVYMGEEDTFYLEGASMLFAETLKELNIEASIEFFPGKDHFSLINDAMIERILTEMDEKLQEKALPN